MLVWVVGHVERLRVEGDASLTGAVVRILVELWRVIERDDLLVGNCVELAELDLLVRILDLILDLAVLTVVDEAVDRTVIDEERGDTYDEAGHVKSYNGALPMLVPTTPKFGSSRVNHQTSRLPKRTPQPTASQ